MIPTEITKHPSWPLYRKVRRYAAQQLLEQGQPPNVAGIDAYLSKNMLEITSDLSLLFRHEVAVCGLQEQSQKLLDAARGHDGGENRGSQ